MLHICQEYNYTSETTETNYAKILRRISMTHSKMFLYNFVLYLFQQYFFGLFACQKQLQSKAVNDIQQPVLPTNTHTHTPSMDIHANVLLLVWCSQNIHLLTFTTSTVFTTTAPSDGHFLTNIRNASMFHLTLISISLSVFI